MKAVAIIDKDREISAVNDRSPLANMAAVCQTFFRLRFDSVGHGAISGLGGGRGCGGER